MYQKLCFMNHRIWSIASSAVQLYEAFKWGNRVSWRWSKRFMLIISGSGTTDSIGHFYFVTVSGERKIDSNFITLFNKPHCQLSQKWNLKNETNFCNPLLAPKQAVFRKHFKRKMNRYKLLDGCNSNYVFSSNELNFK